jgi:peptidoglycan-associated lipoprotein
MLRKLIVVCAMISLCSLMAFSQEQSATGGEIFAGYQYLHASTGISGVDSFTLQGWNAAASGYFTRNLGVTADFSGNYGTPSGVTAKLYTFMFGPSVRFPNSSRITPFGRALFGGGRTTLSASGLSGSETDFTWAAGGGFDVGVTKHVGVRLAQADFLQTRIAGQSQNHFRYSAGLVLKF